LNKEECIKWVLEQGSIYCVNQRLRTPLGNAFQTFESLYHLLIKNPRNTHYLLFIDQFERQVTLAIDGGNSSVHSLATTQFFETNKKVCEDWFARFRNVLAKSSCKASLIKSAFVRLQEVRVGILKCIHEQSSCIKSIADYQRIGFKLCQELSTTRDVDAIHGFLEWTRTLSTYATGRDDTCAKKLEWIAKICLAMSKQCDGRYQEAMTIYASLLDGYTMEESLEEDVEAFDLIMDRLLECSRMVSCPLLEQVLDVNTMDPLLRSKMEQLSLYKQEQQDDDDDDDMDWKQNNKRESHSLPLLVTSSSSSPVEPLSSLSMKPILSDSEFLYNTADASFRIYSNYSKRIMNQC